MSMQFVAEIRAFAGSVIPDGWMACNGQLLRVEQGTALFSLIGNRFGGDGKTTFALPNLNGRAAMGAGAGSGLSNRNLGEAVGAETVRAGTENLPPHTHAVNVSTLTANTTNSSGGSIARSSTGTGAFAVDVNMFCSSSLKRVAMHENSIQLHEGTIITHHENMQPFLCVQLCIAVSGIYPQRPGEE
jgi:microcystin-dependent protein